MIRRAVTQRLLRNVPRRDYASMVRNRRGTRRVAEPEPEPEPEELGGNDSEDSDDEENIQGDGGGGDGNPGGDGDDDDDDDEEEEDEAPAPQRGALTPGQAMRGVLDYETNKAHHYLYRNATKPLEEELFDCTPDQFFQMMKSLEERGNALGWTKADGILWVKRNERPDINLLDNYGSVTLKEIQTYERTYWDTGNRKSQDDRMLYECLMASLSTDGKSRVNVHSDEYHLESVDPGTNKIVKIPSGLCLLKIVIRESYLDSNATTGMIREQLSNLHMHMPNVNNDITRFNNHVKMLLLALKARGERTLDLLTNLFKAYAVCNDKEFTGYIKDLRTDHDMGTRVLNPKTLMYYAEKKFKIMVTTKTWEAPSQVDEEIMALQVRMEKMQEQLKKAEANRSKKKKGGGDDDKKDDSRKRKKKDGDKKERPDWFNSAPEDGKVHEKKFWNGHYWYYCCDETGGKCGGVWRRHKPSECKSDPDKVKKGKGKKFGKYTKGGKKQKTKGTPDITLKEAKFGANEDDDESLLGGYLTDE